MLCWWQWALNLHTLTRDAFLHWRSMFVTFRRQSPLRVCDKFYSLPRQDVLLQGEAAVPSSPLLCWRGRHRGALRVVTPTVPPGDINDDGQQPAHWHRRRRGRRRSRRNSKVAALPHSCCTPPQFADAWLFFLSQVCQRHPFSLPHQQ